MEWPQSSIGKADPSPSIESPQRRWGQCREQHNWSEHAKNSEAKILGGRFGRIDWELKGAKMWCTIVWARSVKKLERTGAGCWNWGLTADLAATSCVMTCLSFYFPRRLRQISRIQAVHNWEKSKYKRKVTWVASAIVGRYIVYTRIHNPASAAMGHQALLLLRSAEELFTTTARVVIMLTAEALVSDPRNQPLLNSQNKSRNMQCLFTFETERARLRCSTHPCSSFRLCCCSFGIGRCFRCHFFHNKAKLTRRLRAQDSFTFTALKQKTF